MQRVASISVIVAHTFLAASCVFPERQPIQESLIEGVPECQSYWPIVAGRLFLGSNGSGEFLVEIATSGEMKSIRLGRAKQVVYDDGKGTVVRWAPGRDEGDPGTMTVDALGERFTFESSLKWTVSPEGDYIVFVHGESPGEQTIAVRKLASDNLATSDAFVRGLQKVLVDDYGRVAIQVPCGLLMLRSLDSGGLEFCGLGPRASAVMMAGERDSAAIVFGLADGSSGTALFVASWKDRGSLEFVPWVTGDPPLGGVYSDFLALTDKGIVGVTQGRLRIFRSPNNASD